MGGQVPRRCRVRLPSPWATPSQIVAAATNATDRFAVVRPTDDRLAVDRLAVDRPTNDRLADYRLSKDPHADDRLSDD